MSPQAVRTVVQRVARTWSAGWLWCLLLILGSRVTLAETTMLVNSLENGQPIRRFDASTGAYIDDFIPAGDGGLFYTRAMAVAPDGTIRVFNADANGYCNVGSYSANDGSFLGYSMQPQQFQHSNGTSYNATPYFHGLAYTADGTAYATNGWNMYRVSSAGTLMGTFGTGSADTWGVTTDGSTVYFTNTGGSTPQGQGRVYAYSVAKGSLQQITANGALNRPLGIVIAPDGHLLVADSGDNCVKEFTAAGALIGDFVAPGAGGLGGPSSLAFGPDGNLYVADDPNDRVLRYDGTSGAFMGVFASNVTNSLAGGPYDIVFADTAVPLPTAVWAGLSLLGGMGAAVRLRRRPAGDGRSRE